MFEKLFGLMIDSRVKRSAAITVVRKNPRFNAESFDPIEKRDFRNEKERADFFKAVFYSRSHI